MDADIGRASLAIERSGTVVSFALTCADEYQAMLIYDRATAELTDGCVKLTFRKPAERPGEQVSRSDSEKPR